MAVFSLKQVVNHYVERGTSVYACFLDLSQAFDTVQYDRLWEKLDRTGLPAELSRILQHWYNNQTNSVRWGSALSQSYRLTCGVRQGGLTSPDLFNVYVNDLIVELSRTNVGLRCNNRYINNLSYADDMVLLSPSVKGLRKLVAICEDYAHAHGLKYNVAKTELLVFRAGRGPECLLPVYLDNVPIKVVERFKYLGHILTSSRKDDEDIERQRRALSVVGNMLVRKFGRCAPGVKVTLFRAYCQTMYTCQLWTRYTKRAHDGIRVQYNNMFRQLMCVPRHCSASGMLAEARVNTFNAVVRHRIAGFMSRIEACTNDIVSHLAGWFHSTIYRRWIEIQTT